MNQVYCVILTYSTVCFVLPLISYKPHLFKIFTINDNNITQKNLVFCNWYNIEKYLSFRNGWFPTNSNADVVISIFFLFIF